MSNTSPTLRLGPQSVGGSSTTSSLAIYNRQKTSDSTPSASQTQRLTFLTLPREIRDEVYTYLLAISPPPTTISYPIWNGETHKPYTVHCKNLSLLRVNRQIHDEASEVFYKRNLWPIRLVIAQKCEQTVDCRYNSHVTYEAPWEEVAYGSICGVGGRFYDLERFYSQQSIGALESKELIMDTKPDLLPAPRYRKFLRHVKVEVLDFRHRDNRAPTPKKSVLLPLMGRLRALLEPAGEQVTVNISLHRNWEVGPDVQEDAHGEKDESSDISLLEAIWPLAMGAWTSRVQTPFDYDPAGVELRDRVFKMCLTQNQFEGGGTPEPEEAAVVGDCYFVIAGGRVKLVRNGMCYDCCYGCDKRDLERRKLSSGKDRRR
ncbi:hypothetical protein TWF481_000444 [Arthrobotrys musiformis]|uniref:F-box domain-containing protein n=1 Tax=Arthrobotrys musiformis TaxID=47236 RepID=A0AAV9WTD0_9PEZI